MRALLLAITAVFLAQLLRMGAIDPQRLEKSQESLQDYPSIESLRLLSDGYAVLVADYYWIAAVSYYGDRRKDQVNYPNLEPLLERTLALDPLFYEAYVFAGLVLTIPGLNPALGVRLLKQGILQRPDKWKLGFLLGFNLFFLYGDDAAAVEALRASARAPGAPRMVIGLATAIAANIGAAGTALHAVDELLQTTDDASLRAFLEGRRQQLLLEVDLARLGGLVEHYQAATGRPPQRLDELVASGLLDQVPQDPLGGTYSIDSNGSVTTTSARLGLHREKPLLEPEENGPSP